MGADELRLAAKTMRQRAEAHTMLPAGTTLCRRDDHPARRHGHYGYGGTYWCSDFRSPLLDEANMGSRRPYAKPVSAPDAFLLAVADWLEWTADNGMERNRAAALPVARAYLASEAVPS